MNNHHLGEYVWFTFSICMEESQIQVLLFKIVDGSEIPNIMAI